MPESEFIPVWQAFSLCRQAIENDPSWAASMAAQNPETVKQFERVARNPLLVYEPFDVPEGTLPDGSPKSSPLKFHRDKSLIRVVSTGNRCTKTTTGAAEVMAACVGFDPVTKKPSKLWTPPLDCWVVSKTEGASIEQAQAIYASMVPWDLVDDKSTYTKEGGWKNSVLKFRPPYNSVVRFKYSKQDLQTFAGTYKHIIHLDEEQPYEYYTECLARTTGTAGRPPGRIIITFTNVYDSDVGLSWIVPKLYARRHEIPSLSFHFWSLFDVPDWIVPPEEKERLPATYDEDEVGARVYGSLTPTGIPLAFPKELINAQRANVIEPQVGWLAEKEFRKKVPVEHIRYLPEGQKWPEREEVETKIVFERE